MKAKQILPGGLVPVGGRRIQGKVVAGKYGGNMYACM
jgi:hypothetical protein